MTTPLSYMKDHIQVLQSELDKANARIAQLENHIKAIKDTQIDKDYQMMGIYIAEAYEDVLTTNNTWLSEHDKAIKAEVLKELAANW